MDRTPTAIVYSDPAVEKTFLKTTGPDLRDIAPWGPLRLRFQVPGTMKSGNISSSSAHPAALQVAVSRDGHFRGAIELVCTAAARAALAGSQEHLAFRTARGVAPLATLAMPPLQSPPSGATVSVRSFS